jgi:hypothetical protein
LPHGILGVFKNTIFYENEFQNPQTDHHVTLFPEQSTFLALDNKKYEEIRRNIAKNSSIYRRAFLLSFTQNSSQL